MSVSLSLYNSSSGVRRLVLSYSLYKPSVFSYPPNDSPFVVCGYGCVYDFIERTSAFYALNCNNDGKTSNWGSRGHLGVFARLDSTLPKSNSPLPDLERMRVLWNRVCPGSLRSCCATVCTSLLLGSTLTAAIELNLDDPGQSCPKGSFLIREGGSDDRTKDKC